MDILKFIRGKKTYIIVAGGLIVSALYTAGVIDQDMANTALVVLGLGGLATLRAGLVNALAQAKQQDAKGSAPPPPPAPPAT